MSVPMIIVCHQGYWKKKCAILLPQLPERFQTQLKDAEEQYSKKSVTEVACHENLMLIFVIGKSDIPLTGKVVSLKLKGKVYASCVRSCGCVVLI